MFSIVLVLVMVFAIYLGMFRNRKVYLLRMSMLDTIDRNNRSWVDDLNNRIGSGLTVGEVETAGRIMSARYEDYSSVSYNEMMLKFWKPVKAEAFYDDTSFLR